MGEPINLFDKDGQPVTMYAPATAAELVAAGELFVEKPPKPKPAPKSAPKRKAPRRKPAAKKAA